MYTYLLFQFVEVFNDDTNEEIECEESSKHDENDKVDIPVESSFCECLGMKLQKTMNGRHNLVCDRHIQCPQMVFVLNLLVLVDS